MNEGAIDKADDVSEKTAIEAEASSSDPPPRYSRVYKRETASEGNKKYGKEARAGMDGVREGACGEGAHTPRGKVRLRK